MRRTKWEKRAGLRYNRNGKDGTNGRSEGKPEMGFLGMGKGMRYEDYSVFFGWWGAVHADD